MNEAQAIQDRVREIIERARREQSKYLDLSSYALSGSKLDKIPDEVFDLPQLETLSLLENNIREVPERIRDLANLKSLYVVRNPIEKVPDIPGLALDWAGYLRCRKTLSSQNVEEIWIEIDEKQSSRLKGAREVQLRRELALLPRLRRLHVSLLFISSDAKIPKPTGEIRDLIDKLSQFHHLECLSFFGVLLEDVPSGIRNLKRLWLLGMHGAGLREIPDWLGELGHLHVLGLGMNDLTTLPTSLANLSELERIDLSTNRFTEIPELVLRMRNLKRLNIGCDSWRGYKGSIKQIPAEILQLPKLEELHVDGQPIEVPPPEVVKEGVEAIKNYWRQQQEVGIDYLCEAKLIVVGEAGTGKTTLAKKLQNPEYHLEPQEPSTEGIDVIRWSFPSAVRVKRDGREALHHTDFKVSIWDFGGQEIYHATHQFFLTRRSLYALVADDRKEDTDFNYWLQVVELLSTSPHKRGMEIMRLWPPGFHTWPSLSPRIWWTTEMDGHAHSIRRQKPASVPQDVSCPQNRRSATASAARSRTTAPLDSSRSNARGESGTQSVDVWPTRLAPVCPYASGDYRGSHEWS